MTPPTWILQVLKVAGFLEPSRALFGVQGERQESDGFGEPAPWVK